jgi:hypothetical protein
LISFAIKTRITIYTILYSINWYLLYFLI